MYDKALISDPIIMNWIKPEMEVTTNLNWPRCHYAILSDKRSKKRIIS